MRGRLGRCRSQLYILLPLKIILKAPGVSLAMLHSVNLNEIEDGIQALFSWHSSLVLTGAKPCSCEVEAMFVRGCNNVLNVVIL